MKGKLNCVLLIDDDEPTNFLHTIVLEEVGCAENIVAVQSGQAALDFLTSKEAGDYPQPELIFLDINMPAMNGWEFLKEYEKLPTHQQAKVVLVMLTTSLNPADKKRANGCSSIDGFLNKALTEEALIEVLNQYFPER